MRGVKVNHEDHALSVNEPSAQNQKLLQSALQQLFSFCLSLNLSQNQYQIIQPDPLLRDDWPVKGNYDRFLNKMADQMRDKQMGGNFRARFSAETLLQRFKEDPQHEISLCYALQNDKKETYWCEGRLKFVLPSQGEIEAYFYERAFKTAENDKNRIAVSNEKEIVDRVSEANAIKLLSDRYDYVCNIDFDQQQVVRLRVNEEFRRHLGISNERVVSLPAFFESIRSTNFRDDLDQLQAEMTYEHLNEVLDRRKYCEYLGRINLSGNPTYYRYRFMRQPESPRVITMGLVNVNEQVKSEIRQGEREAAQHYVEMMRGLSSSFEAVYNIHVDTNNYEFFGRTLDFEGAISSEFHHGKDFFQDTYVNSKLCIHPEDFDKVVTYLGKEYAVHMPANRQIISFDYRVRKQEKYYWYQVKMFKDVDSDGRELLIVGVLNIDSVILQERTRQRALQQKDRVSAMLTENYVTIIYYNVNAIQKPCTFYVYDHQNEGMLVESLQDGSLYEYLRRYGLIFVPLSDREAFLSKVTKEMILSKIEKNEPYLVTFKSGTSEESHYMQLKFIPDYSNGELVGIIVGCINTDHLVQEEQERARQVKKSQEKLLRLLAVLSSDFTGMYDVDLSNDDWSLYNIYYDKDGTIKNTITTGDKFFERVGPDAAAQAYEEDVERIVAFFNREKLLPTLSAATFRSFDLRLMVQGKPVWFRDRIILSNESDGHTHMYIAVQNLTEEHRLEMESKHKTETIHALAQEYTGILYVDFEHDSYTVYSLSDRIQGVTRALVLNNNHLCPMLQQYTEFAVHPDDRAQFAAIASTMDKALQNKQSISTFFRRNYSGEYLYTEMLCVKNEEIDQPPKTAIIAFSEKNAMVEAERAAVEEQRKNLELTQKHKQVLEEKQKALEEALKKAEAASSAKSTFLTNMSHDIRTPMNAIIGFTHLAITHIENQQRVLEYLEKTAISSQHLLSLINDILDMRRIESGKIQLEETECKLSAIMHDINSIILGQAQAKQQHLFLNSFDVKDEAVCCDKLRLNQVLINLLGNAVKFTPLGGHIRFWVTQVGSISGYGQYEFHVKDDGIGMTPEFAKKMFDPFERAQTSTISKTQGTGLGMSITKSIVELMGGSIDVQSELDKGTEIVVHLNLKLARNQEKLDPIEALLTQRALVVDDDHYACESEKKLLELFGMEGDFTLSGEEAIQKAKDALSSDDPYSLYIIDWVIPDLMGIDVVREIRKMVGPQIPIIIATAYDWSDIEEDAKKAGATTFVTKPVFYSDLHQALSYALGVDAEDVPANESAEASFDGKKVLLVEDNEINREIAQEILEESGFVVSSTEDGALAVEIIRDAKPGDYDLILMDVQMPIMDGYEATRQIRAMKDNPLSKIPIIAMTANAFKEDRELALKAGMNEHVAKPIDVHQLLKVLSKIFANAPQP